MVLSSFPIYFGPSIVLRTIVPIQKAIVDISRETGSRRLLIGRISNALHGVARSTGVLNRNSR
jgi:hypothetical protein